MMSDFNTSAEFYEWLDNFDNEIDTKKIAVPLPSSNNKAVTAINVSNKIF